MANLGQPISLLQRKRLRPNALAGSMARHRRPRRPFEVYRALADKGLMKKTTRIGFVFAFALWLCAPSPTFGQAVYGSIVGTVRDTSGASVPNAKVTVLYVAKGVAHSTTSNDTGNYSQTHLIVGVYEVRIEAPSFETFVQRNVTVEVDSTTQVNAQLAVGKVGEVVNVTAE